MSAYRPRFNETQFLQQEGWVYYSGIWCKRNLRINDKEFQTVLEVHGEPGFKAYLNSLPLDPPSAVIRYELNPQFCRHFDWEHPCWILLRDQFDPEHCRPRLELDDNPDGEELVYRLSIHDSRWGDAIEGSTWIGKLFINPESKYRLRTVSLDRTDNGDVLRILLRESPAANEPLLTGRIEI